MTKGRSSTRVGIRIQDDALGRLTASAAKANQSVGAYLRTILERDMPGRYEYLIDTARTSLKDRFTTGECGLMLDVCNGIMFESYSIPLLAAEIADAEDEYYPKWGCDRAEILAKLRALTIVETFAVVDAIEAWWAATQEDQKRDPGKLLS